MGKIAEFLKTTFSPIEEKPHSMNALMENGSMKSGSISGSLYDALMEAYKIEYQDTRDMEDVVTALSANYHNEVEIAWQAFLAGIGYND
jgi:hypothetical protein